MPTGKQRHMTPEEEKLYHAEFVKALQIDDENEVWRICIDRGRGSEELVERDSDTNKICLRIGQLALSTDIEKIIVYRNDEEYRRYELKRASITSGH